MVFKAQYDGRSQRTSRRFLLASVKVTCRRHKKSVPPESLGLEDEARRYCSAPSGADKSDCDSRGSEKPSEAKSENRPVILHEKNRTPRKHTSVARVKKREPKLIPLAIL